MMRYRINQYISQKPTTHRIITVGEEVRVSMLMLEEDDFLYKPWIKIQKPNWALPNGQLNSRSCRPRCNPKRDDT